jgi:lipopolysaccharide/colanic/teichoic acid biosynthesis glycosyltransferase
MPGNSSTGYQNHPVWALFIKRGIDVMASIAALAVFFPLLLIIAIAVKLSSPGPIFYRGVRTGLNGVPFRILKFRTMVNNAEAMGGPTTGTNDKRVTRVGAYIRRAKLDELPQFINVLMGDMSLVGPRPEVLEYTATYKDDEKIILTMRPGITDYASIEFANLDDIVGDQDPDQYFREHIMPRKTELRKKYVKEWSLMSDFKILFTTFSRVLKRITDR